MTTGGLVDMNFSGKTLLLAAGLCCFGCRTALAQAPPGKPSDATLPVITPAVENVVVTAQKRSQKVQDVPISITVLDSKKLRQLNVQSSDELAQYVPSVEIGLPSGRGNQPLIVIRGVGLNDTNTNNAGPNGVYVDEVYEGSPAGQTLQTFDLSRVEVLRGPQGTLYGRNTTGGAIDFVTAKPTDDFLAQEDIQYGSFNSVSSETILNGALSPRINGRVAIDYNYSDGFFSDLTDGNKTNGSNDLAYRGELSIQATDDLSLLLNFHGGNVNRRPDEYHHFGLLDGPAGGACTDVEVVAGSCTDFYGYKGPSSFYKGFYDNNQNLYINSVGGSARADYHLDGITLTSISAIEESHKIDPEDSDADPYHLIEIVYGVKSTDISQEFRATGSGDKYHWLFGLYGSTEHLQQNQSVSVFTDINQVLGPLIGIPDIGNGIAERARILNGQFTESVAAFTQGDYEIFPNAHLTLGGRLTYEHKTFDAFAQSAFQENGVFPAESPLYAVAENIADRAASYRTSFDYKFLSNVLGYASISTGFKSAGFNGGFLANDVPEALVQLRAIKPEYIIAYESGVKSDFFSQHLRVNLDGFYYSYRDLQTYNLIQSPNATGGVVLPLSVLTNAPTATIKGSELEVDATPLPNLTTSASVSYVDSNIGKFVSNVGAANIQDLTGKRLPNSPRWDVILQIGYSVPLKSGAIIQISSSATYKTKQFFELDNNPLVAQGAYWLADARLAYESANRKWELSLLGKNLSGSQYFTHIANGSSGFGLLAGVVGPPRYVGGELVFRYYVCSMVATSPRTLRTTWLSLKGCWRFQ